jgi:hypothetical protein
MRERGAIIYRWVRGIQGQGETRVEVPEHFQAHRVRSLEGVHGGRKAVVGHGRGSVCALLRYTNGAFCASSSALRFCVDFPRCGKRSFIVVPPSCSTG